MVNPWNVPKENTQIGKYVGANMWEICGGKYAGVQLIPVNSS